MKKILVFSILVIMLTSCVKSVYEVKYIDTKYPTDTLTATAVTNERFSFRGDDTRLEMTVKNIGLPNCPVMVYELNIEDAVNSLKFHVSYNPINIVSLKYVGPKEKESMWGPKEKE